MVNRMLNETNEDDSDDAVVEVATKTEYTLVRPQANRAAVYWSKYKLYHSRLHPEKKTFAVCMIPGCGKEISFKCGNGGLCRHLQFKHREVYEELYGLNPKTSKSPPTKTEASVDSTIYDLFSPRHGVDMIQKIFKARATYWAIDQYQPFQAFNKDSFRNMFEPLHTDWKKIVATANAKSVRESVYRLGKLAKDATSIEMVRHKGSWTADHWTGPDKQT